MRFYKHVKLFPEDFAVKELISDSSDLNKKHVLFSLLKYNFSTLDALRIISKIFNIKLQDIGFSGLKDKYALTYQYLTFSSKVVNQINNIFVLLTEDGYLKLKNNIPENILNLFNFFENNFKIERIEYYRSILSLLNKELKQLENKLFKAFSLKNIENLNNIKLFNKSQNLKNSEKIDNVKIENIKIISWFAIIKTNRSYIFLEPGIHKGNSFLIKIRNFEEGMLAGFKKNINSVKKYGFPNYFGEQRFGTLKKSNTFLLKELLKLNYEKALKMYLKGKGDLKFFGKWSLFYKHFANNLESFEKDLILGLKRGLSYEKAFKILPKNIRVMFNFSYQSFLWNLYLSEYIKKKYSYCVSSFVNNWILRFYKKVKDIEYLEKLKIPFTGKDYKVEDSLIASIIKEVQLRQKITVEDFDREILGIKVLTDGLRKAIVILKDINFVYDKTKKEGDIIFELEPGSYATILLRRLMNCKR